ncbi:MAG: MerR family DNA-binding transcriptional regulator, partial [Solobacterium sp.]|nr:MerR family DNA-binding transcriptional regulator [Solobacterium sp.]
MLKIGEFSKLARISVRMLRHYDEIGLLKPAETDPFTDYRYYREDQLPTAGRIAALKDMGFSLADIVSRQHVDQDGAELVGARGLGRLHVFVALDGHDRGAHHTRAAGD